jgi:alpha-beta hydrolase superfamily lysophospholipase
VHGSGEHCQRYRHVAQFFNKRNIPCVAYDLRGHGLSGGERGFTPHINALLDDLECVIDHIRKQLHFNIPLVIYAHGTGCVNCIGHVLRRSEKPLDCQAMILSTPSVCLKTRPNHVMFFVSRAFANLSPHFRLPVHGNYSNEYANDPAIVEAYRIDPLVHDRWPARTISLLLEVGYLLETTVIEFPVPVMIQHGAADKITPIEIIQKWVRERVKVKANDLTFKEWPGHYHELHNDMEKQEILDYALDWIEKRSNNEKK